MSERKRRVEDVLESMGRMVVPVPDDPEAERERVIEGVNLKLDMARKARRAGARQRWLFVAAAAAVCLSAGAALAHFRKAEPRAAIVDVPANVFRRGDAVRTEVTESRKGSLENGAEVALSGGTELTVSALVPGTDEIVLDRGRVDLTVPKLGAGHTLSVTTPDATVTVRGTRFSVEVVVEGSHAITSVQVTQGSVWVRRGDTRLVLEAGSHWSSRSPEPAPAPIAPSEQVASPAAAPLPRPAVSTGSGSARAEATPPPGTESSTLGQENDLYASAQRAAREGNDTLATNILSTFLARYPSSPLAQNARVDRFRALGRSRRGPEAVAQARRYLADYPNGFARDEAKALVLQSLASP